MCPLERFRIGASKIPLTIDPIKAIHSMGFLAASPLGKENIVLQLDRIVFGSGYVSHKASCVVKILPIRS